MNSDASRVRLTHSVHVSLGKQATRLYNEICRNRIDVLIRLLEILGAKVVDGRG